MRKVSDGAVDPQQGRIGASDCERLRPGLVAQPVNTVTSLGYVVAGAVVMARHHQGDPGRLRQVRLYSSMLALVGLGSVAFHGPQPPGARAMHDLPIPALLALAIGTPLVRARRGEPALPGWTRRRGGTLAMTTVAGLATYAGGRTGAPTCDPDSPIQLHGAWHLLSASNFVRVADIIYGRTSDG